MSADLFAEFGSPSTTPTPTPTPTNIDAVIASSITSPPPLPQPERTNTDLGSAIGLVSIVQSPVTRYVQQPWLQANSQTTGSPFSVTSPGRVSPGLARLEDGLVGLGLGRDGPDGIKDLDNVFDLGSQSLAQTMQAAIHESPRSIDNDEELWGDFETAAPETTPAPVPASAPAPAPKRDLSQQTAPPPVRSVHLARYSDKPVRNRIIRADTLDLMTNKVTSSSSSSSSSAPKTQASGPTSGSRPPTSALGAALAPDATKKGLEPSRARDTNILFDAEDYDAYEMGGDGSSSADENEDEFGEFESVPAQQQQQQPSPVRRPHPSHGQHQQPSQESAAPTDLLSLLDLDSPPLPTTAPSTASMLSPPIWSPFTMPSTLPSPDLGDWTRLSFGAARASSAAAASVAGSIAGSISGTQPPLGSPATSVNSVRLQVKTPERSPLGRNQSLPAADATPVTAWPSGLNSAPLFRDSKSPFQDSPRALIASPLAQNPLINGGASPQHFNWDWKDDDDAAAAPAPAPTKTANPTNHARPKPTRTTTAPAPTAPAPRTIPTPNLSDDLDPTEPPPTNIPPPSVLLTIFPEILVEAASCLFAPLAKHAASPALRERVMSDPKTLGFLSAHLAVAVVAARVLAGRRLRWQRDRFLAASMAISGSTTTGAARGMKIASVNRAEGAREDREAVDFVALWRRDVGRLRSAVAAANAAAGARGCHVLTVPEIADAMVVQTAKGSPTSPKACVVCGLRRDERVARVDLNVEDSFGEWWIEHWGHRTCRNFWKQTEERMRQR